MVGGFRMKENMIGKILTVSLLTIFLGFLGFIVAVFTSLMGGLKFYTPFVVIVTVAIIVFSTIFIFKFMKPRTFKISILSFACLCVAAVIGYEAIEAYHNSFETLNDAEVDLYEYHPFSETTKAVSLQETSTLKLEKDLPILDGATALYPVYSAFVKATYPQEQYDLYKSEVMSSKTDGAYLKLINGEVDIIFAAGPSKRQLQLAEQKGVEMKLTPIGREAFVFFVNSKNPVDNITLEEIRAIYSGEIENWSELGGNDASIRAFQRPADSGSQTALENLMGEKILMTPPKEDVVSGMGGIISKTSSYRNYKNAIGYSFRFFSTEMVKNGQIRHMKINSVFPDKESIRNGKYPIAAEFYAITAGTDNPNVDRFIEWILSDQGQYLIEETGYVPVIEND